jgi:HEAT repeat protein
MPILLVAAAVVTAATLVQQFEEAGDDGSIRQGEIAQRIVALHDASVLARIEPYLRAEDRCVRGNAAFVFAGLGDDRGLRVLEAILANRSFRSPRPRGAVIGLCSPRYHAAHLLGDLKDPRGMPILLRSLDDRAARNIVPWALGRIGDRRAFVPLLNLLDDRDPDMRALASCGLEALGDRDALPALRSKLGDSERIHFDGLGPVSDAAREAISGLEGRHRPEESMCGGKGHSPRRGAPP